MNKIVITGASSGIGKATAKHFAVKGWEVAATMRKPEREMELVEIESIKLYPLDVTDKEMIDRTSSQILQEFETVDIVMNNAGFGLAGPFEAATSEQIQRQFDTNVFGLMNVTRAFLPHFRSNRAGMFVNISSVGGLSTYPFVSLYHATKWAVEGFSESLSYELAELGIQVKIIEPGAVSTDFGGRSMDFAIPTNFSDYEPSVQRYMDARAKSDRVLASAEVVASGIYEATTDGKQQLRYPVGDAGQIFELRRQLGDEGFLKFMQEQMLKKRNG
ncbi:MAG: SDR family oxidoreductase [Bacteroidota bacterium]